MHISQSLRILQSKIKINSTHTRRQFFYIALWSAYYKREQQKLPNKCDEEMQLRLLEASLLESHDIWELFYFSHWKQISHKIITNIPLCPLLREAHRNLSISPDSCPQCPSCPDPIWSSCICTVEVGKQREQKSLHFLPHFPTCLTAVGIQLWALHMLTKALWLSFLLS